MGADYPSPLLICIEHHDSTVAMAVRGELDVASVGPFAKVVSDAMRDGFRRVELDLTSVTFIDVTALRAVARCVEHLRRRGRAMAIVGVSQQVARLALLLECEAPALDVATPGRPGVLHRSVPSEDVS